MNRVTETQRDFLLTLWQWHNDSNNTFTLNDSYELWIKEALLTKTYDIDMKRRLNKIRLEHLDEYSDWVSNDVPEFEYYTLKEVQHLSGNFAMTIAKGYDKSFDEWFKNIEPSWRDIANGKNKI